MQRAPSLKRLFAVTAKLEPRRWTTGMIMDLYWSATKHGKFVGATTDERRTAIDRIAAWCKWIIGQSGRERAKFYMQWIELRRIREQKPRCGG